MAQQLVYTSAERGLETGASGYCTVQQTRDMGKILAGKLESLSVYTHLFNPTPHRDNPVAFSHLIIQAGEKSYSVVSRICDYDLDYTGRTNFLTHHVVLNNSERPHGGPAWLLNQPGFLLTRWDGQARFVTEKQIPQGDKLAGFCSAWQAAAGDAGWGGVLADWYLDDSRTPAYVLYEPSLNVLPLIEEALAFIPAGDRWQVTFSTFYGKHLTNDTCAWRFVPAGTIEAKTAARSKNSRVIDLTGRPGAPPQSERVREATRLGAPVVDNSAAKTSAVPRLVTQPPQLSDPAGVASRPGETSGHDSGGGGGGADTIPPPTESSTVPTPASAVPPIPLQGSSWSSAPPPGRKLSMNEADIVRDRRGPSGAVPPPQPLKSHTPGSSKTIILIAACLIPMILGVVAGVIFIQNKDKLLQKPTENQTDNPDQRKPTDGDARNGKSKNKQASTESVPQKKEPTGQHKKGTKKTDSPTNATTKSPRTNGMQKSIITKPEKPNGTGTGGQSKKKKDQSEKKETTKTPPPKIIQVTESFVLRPIEKTKKTIPALQNVEKLQLFGLELLGCQCEQEYDANNHKLKISVKAPDSKNPNPLLASISQKSTSQQGTTLEFEQFSQTEDLYLCAAQLKWCVLEIKPRGGKRRYFRLSNASDVDKRSIAQSIIRKYRDYEQWQMKYPNFREWRKDLLGGLPPQLIGQEERFVKNQLKVLRPTVRTFAGNHELTPKEKYHQLRSLQTWASKASVNANNYLISHPPPLATAENDTNTEEYPASYVETEFIVKLKGDDCRLQYPILRLVPVPKAATGNKKLQSPQNTPQTGTKPAKPVKQKQNVNKLGK